MTEKFTLTGGARIGMAKASYPFADLYVDKNSLKINASIAGNLVFQPKDIIELKLYTSVPVIGNGIKIIHRVEKYNKEVIFWTFKDPKFVLSEIEKTGFLENINSHISDLDLEIMKRQDQGGFPIKKSAATLFFIVWNVLLMSAFLPVLANQESEGFHFGIGINIALGLLFLTSVLTLISKSFTKLILKEGRELADIKKFVYLIILISGIMSITFGLARFW